MLAAVLHHHAQPLEGPTMLSRCSSALHATVSPLYSGWWGGTAIGASAAGRRRTPCLLALPRPHPGRSAAPLVLLVLHLPCWPPLRSGERQLQLCRATGGRAAQRANAHLPRLAPLPHRSSRRCSATSGHRPSGPARRAAPDPRCAASARREAAASPWSSRGCWERCPPRSAEGVGTEAVNRRRCCPAGGWDRRTWCQPSPGRRGRPPRRAQPQPPAPARRATAAAAGAVARRAPTRPVHAPAPAPPAPSSRAAAAACAGLLLAARAGHAGGHLLLLHQDRPHRPHRQALPQGDPARQGPQARHQVRRRAAR